MTATLTASVIDFLAAEETVPRGKAPCPSTRVHNTVWAYRKRGCRCSQAIAKMRAKWRQDDHNPSGLTRRTRRRQRRSEAARYIDSLAVELACRGDRVSLTVHERRAAIDRLDNSQLTVEQIAERLHIATRTVERHRAARRVTTSQQPTRGSQ